MPYVATFLIFSDYLRPSLRLAALMGIKVIYLFTHDSIGLGGDGPTHQPVEHLMSLRAIPNLLLLRPADANETAQAWEVAVKHQGGPVVLALSRQDLPHLAIPQGAVVKGAYVLSESSGLLRLVLVATGSEVSLALAAQAALMRDGIGARVVSMPSWELFDRQDAAYRDAVLPPMVPRLALEAGATLGWYKYLGATGSVIGVDRFGASAPGEEVMARYGFSVESVVQAAKELLG
jgi:transketolase